MKQFIQYANNMGFSNEQLSQFGINTKCWYIERREYEYRFNTTNCRISHY
jgi:hypothetical protein